MMIPRTMNRPPASRTLRASPSARAADRDEPDPGSEESEFDRRFPLFDTDEDDDEGTITASLETQTSSRELARQREAAYARQFSRTWGTVPTSA